MLTNNYYSILKVQSTGLQQTGIDVSGASTVILFNPGASLDYTYSALALAKAALSGRAPSGAMGSCYIILGTGTTEPTPDDYTLSGDAITAFSVLSNTYTCSETADSIECTREMVIKNTGSDDFTIGEIAWFGQVWKATSASWTPMIDRTILETPLTIPAGACGQVNYTIHYPKSSAV